MVIWSEDGSHVNHSVRHEDIYGMKSRAALIGIDARERQCIPHFRSSTLKPIPILRFLYKFRF